MSPIKILHTEINGNTSTINHTENFDKVSSSSYKNDENCKYNSSNLTQIENFTDIICDNSPIRISALRHAAQISPLVSGNSFFTNTAPEKLKQPNLLSNKPIPIKGTKSNDSIKRPLVKVNISTETLPVDMVNHNYSIKKQQRDLLKKSLVEREELLIKENKKRKELLENSINNRNNWLYNKLENDKNIYETAESYANQTAEQNDIQIQKIVTEKETKLKQISYEAISKYQIKFKERYEKLTGILLTIDKNLINCEKYNNNLKELIANFENLIKKIKNYEIGPSEILYAELLCNRIRSLENKLLSDATNIKQQQQQQLQQQQQQQQQKLENDKIINTNILPPSSNQPPPELQQITIKQEIPKPTISTDIPDSKNNIGFISNGITEENLRFYSNIMRFYNEKLEAIQQLKNDENMKKFKIACKRTINIAVCSICAVSPQHLQDKFDKIYNFITGNTVKTSASDVNVLDHPQGKDFCLILLASILVKQGDTEVSSNAKAAFPIATIIVSIWNRLPEFGNIFLGQVFKESPYLVPYFIPKHKDQSNESYLKSLGYQMMDGVGLEKHHTFLTRQSGIMRLYTAVMITSARKADQQHHPYGIDNGWRWFSNMINLSPLPDICATLLYEFLQTAGYDMWSTYGQQFRKLLIFTQQQYMPQLSKIEDREPPKLRLEGFLQQVLQQNKIDKPNGTLSNNYW